MAQRSASLPRKQPRPISRTDGGGVLRVSTRSYCRLYGKNENPPHSQAAVLDSVAENMARTYNKVSRAGRARSRSVEGGSFELKLVPREISLDRNPRDRGHNETNHAGVDKSWNTMPRGQKPRSDARPAAERRGPSDGVARRTLRPATPRPASAPGLKLLPVPTGRPRPIIGGAAAEPFPIQPAPTAPASDVGRPPARRSPATSSLEGTDDSVFGGPQPDAAPPAVMTSAARTEYPRPLQLALPKYSPTFHCPPAPPGSPPSILPPAVVSHMTQTSREESSPSSTDDSRHYGQPRSPPLDVLLQWPDGRDPELQPPVKGYMGSPSSSMFDDDPGIMSEAETASTGFRRGVKIRSSLPVVRTTSKTMERPLGVVFLQYRSETKRALLPNEITSLDTVKALFVRSFQHQLTMEYLDSPACKIYILDSSRDVFYDMEDIRSLSGRDIRDRSVLRIFETDQPQTAPTNGTTWDDNSYFSEPEFDGDQQNQHVHKTKGKGDGFRMGAGPYPVGARPAGTYPPRGQPDVPPASRGYHPGSGPPPKPQRAGCAGGRSSRAAAAPRPVFYPGDGYAGSPERGRGYPYGGGAAGFGEQQYYPPPYRNPLVDEEARLAGFFDPVPARRVAGGRRFDDKVRVESMERQLANLTGLVQKALHAPRVNRAVSDLDSGYRSDRETYYRTPSDKSVSFEKSVSFSDEPHDPNVPPKQHSPTHAADKVPVKPAIKSSTLPRMGSQDLHLSPETYNQLRSLQKKARDLRQEMRKLRRLSQDHATAVNEMIGDTYSKIRVCLLASSDLPLAGAESDSARVRKQEDAYSKDVLGVEKDLSEVEQHVEDLRSNVINRRRRVNMTDVESMALVLSKSSKTVADLQKRFPELQTELRGLVAEESERVKKEERFIGEEPLRLENALRRIKKLSGTLVTLKRLASVQEQRVPETEENPAAAAAKPADAQTKAPREDPPHVV